MLSINRVLFAAGGVLAGLLVAKILNVSSLAAKVGIGTSAAA